jgi:hypothetical protein
MVDGSDKVPFFTMREQRGGCLRGWFKCSLKAYLKTNRKSSAALSKQVPSGSQSGGFQLLLKKEAGEEYLGCNLSGLGGILLIFGVFPGGLRGII